MSGGKKLTAEQLAKVEFMVRTTLEVRRKDPQVYEQILQRWPVMAELVRRHDAIVARRRLVS